jgi:predicted ester cyclase
MADEKIADVMREYVKAMADGDVEKALACCTDDAIDVSPYGTYKGKTEIRRSLEALAKNMKDMKVTETGNGIIVQGDKAFFEHVISGTFEGKRFEFLAMCAYEFSGDKIKEVRTTFDRLLLAQQVVTGWPAKPLVNMVVRQAEKGMK